MGVGGMVGGGIFSVLGLSVSLSGHAAPIAFLLGGILAMLTGLSYARLGLAFRSDGGSFTYLEHAFHHQNIAGLGGWLLLTGYVGTMTLYSYTFAVYGSAMLGFEGNGSFVSHLLGSAILLVFLAINLYGVRAAGQVEDILVLVKVAILTLFATVGLFSLNSDHLLPVFNRGETGVLMGAALIFVAYEGFELIPNAVNEMRNPDRNLLRGITLSIGITIFIYIVVSLVAVGNLTGPEIVKYKESALAIAAKPFLGQAGFLLIGLGAVLSSASAINATMFGSARLGSIMAQDKALPEVFSHRERTRDIPWVSLCILTALTLIFVNTGSLTIISAFASATFLLIFASINLSAFRLRKTIGGSSGGPLTGLVLCLVSLTVLYIYLWNHNRVSLLVIALGYLVIVIVELLFTERQLFARRPKKS